ncbi:MAG TPA: hypothetical protein VGE07_20355 [Herpetosiphonaceae bacterium]
MKIYWGYNSIPELAGLPRKQQTALWRDCLRAATQSPKALLGYLSLAVMIGVCTAGASLLTGGAVPGWVWAGIFGGLGGFIANQTLIRAMRPLLAARRAAMEPQPDRSDGSYHVPPAW